MHLFRPSRVSRGADQDTTEKTMKEQTLNELILQSLEHEQGGVQVYETAVRLAINDDLREEWEKYLAQTRRHVELLTEVCATFDLDPNEQIPARAIVRTVGEALVKAMTAAAAAGNPEAAELVACEAIVLAETKDHANWELIGECASGRGEKTHDSAEGLRSGRRPGG